MYKIHISLPPSPANKGIPPPANPLSLSPSIPPQLCPGKSKTDPSCTQTRAIHTPATQTPYPCSRWAWKSGANGLPSARGASNWEYWYGYRCKTLCTHCSCATRGGLGCRGSFTDLGNLICPKIPGTGMCRRCSTPRWQSSGWR